MTSNGDHPSLKDVLLNKRQIDSILKFWFGQYNPDLSQKQLWMISASSEQHMQQVDETITLQFYPLVWDIFENKNNQRDHWCSEVEWFHWQGKLASIILLDQMSRHIRRHVRWMSSHQLHTAHPEQELTQLPDQPILDNLAYSIALRFQLEHTQEISSGMIPLPMCIFSLMPYRHASTLHDLSFVLHKIEEMATLHCQDMDNMIRRFRRASNRRMAGLQDEARRKGLPTIICDHQSISIDEDDETVPPPDIEKSLEDNDDDDDDDDILETMPFDADLSTAGDHIIVKTLVQFLKSRNIVPQSDQTKHGCIPIIISLSGGVDSMVIAHALTYLRDHGHYGHLHIMAVHIDYGNRPESPAEAEYVVEYSMQRLKLEDCIVKKVEEFKRGITARDEYEKATRNIRYDLYKATIRRCKEHLSCATDDIGVMLGHHLGDVRENVLSNAHKGCGPLDLSGMTAISMNDGVCIYRPLLTLEKTKIFDYAHKFGVPYFKDTTPHWSTRGKLRNKLLPLLEEIYGDGSMMNLTNLARESDEARLLINENVLKSFMDKVAYYPMGIIFHTKQFINQSFYFWKLALRDVLHSAKKGMFGDKLIAAFLNRVTREKITPGWLQCRTDYSVYLQEDGRVCIFHPELFPPGDENVKENYLGQVVPFGEEHALQIGSWKVCCKVEEDAVMELLEQKAVSSWNEFMNGHVKYYMRIPENKSLIVIPHFRKQNRPKAWKGVDTKIEKTLPILGLDLLAEEKKDNDFIFVREVMSIITIDLMI